MITKKQFTCFSVLFFLNSFFFSCKTCIECKVEYYKNGQFYSKIEDNCGTNHENDKFKEDFCNSVPLNDSSSTCGCGALH